MSSLAQRFFDRFRGLDRSHGQYRLKNATITEKGKVLGQASTVRTPATLELWESHLSGTLGVGIVPIRDDATVVFGAIDIDVYKDLDLKKLSKEIEALELPLILCRSKSGGAQLYLFMKEPAPADLVRGKLMEWAVTIGHGGVEVFPKQTRLAGANDFGNWINMPYFDADKTERYAIYSGKKLTAEKFLDLADMMAQSVESLRDFQVEHPPEFEEWWEQAPPCLQTISKNGFGEGSRNNALFNIGVYLRKRYGDDMWEEYLDKYNQKFLKPPLGHKEVAQIARSVKRKTYEYKCNDLPISQFCNRQICLTRKHGIGTNDDDPGVAFGNILKLSTEPPTWIWDVNGARIELTTAELKDQARFHTRCIEELNVWPNPLKPKKWADLVREKLLTVEIMEVPPDATPGGQMWTHLQNYCTGRAKARNVEELLQDKPYQENGHVYFNSNSFQRYLRQQGMNVSPRQLWNWLKERGAKHEFKNIKGRGINLWYVPSFAEQREEFDVPNVDDIEEM